MSDATLSHDAACHELRRAAERLATGEYDICDWYDRVEVVLFQWTGRRQIARPDFTAPENHEPPPSLPDGPSIQLGLGDAPASRSSASRTSTTPGSRRRAAGRSQGRAADPVAEPGGS